MKKVTRGKADNSARKELWKGICEKVLLDKNEISENEEKVQNTCCDNCNSNFHYGKVWNQHRQMTPGCTLFVLPEGAE